MFFNLEVRVDKEVSFEIWLLLEQEIMAGDKLAISKKPPNNYSRPSILGTVKRKRPVDPNTLLRDNICSLADLLNTFPHMEGLLTDCDSSVLTNSKNYFFAKLDDDDDYDVCTKSELISFFEGCLVQQISIDQTSLMVTINYISKENVPSTAKKPKLSRPITYFLNKRMPLSPTNNASQTHSVEYKLIYMTFFDHNF